MRLTLENIAKVRKADVEINGITVIAGENNTGKSTVGKALYSVFNSLYHVEDQMRDERVMTISNLLGALYLQIRNRGSRNVELREVAGKILDEYPQQQDKKALIRQAVLDFLFDFGEADVAFNDAGMDETVDKIGEILAISDDEILKRVIAAKLNGEFNEQINNVYREEDGTIELLIRNNTFKLFASENRVKDISTPFPLKTEIVYLDDPFVLDEVRSYRTILRFPLSESSFALRQGGTHRDQVRDKLSPKRKKTTLIDEILTDQKL